MSSPKQTEMRQESVSPTTMDSVAETRRKEGIQELCRVVEKYVTTPDRMVWVLQLLLAKLRKLDKLPPWDEMVGYGEDTEEDDTEEDDDDEENEEEDEDEDDRVHKSDVVDNGDNNGDKDGSQENRTEAPA